MPRIHAVVRDDRAPLFRRLARWATSPARRFHHNERGNVTVIMMGLVLLFYGLTSSVINTGTVVSEKIQLQTAADTAAYASALHLSRETNLVTAANIAITLNASAQGVNAAVFLGWPIGVGQLAAHIAKAGQYISEASKAIASLFGAPYGIALMAWAVPYLLESVFELLDVVFWGMGDLEWFQSQLPEFFNTMGTSNGLSGRINDLHEFQDSVVRETPDIIDRQRAFLEEFYRCEIVIAQAGQGPLPNALSHAVEPDNQILGISVPLSVSYYGSPIPFVEALEGMVKQPDYEEIEADFDAYKNMNDRPRQRFAFSGQEQEVFGQGLKAFGYTWAWLWNGITRQRHYVLKTNFAAGLLEENPGMSDNEREAHYDQNRSFIVTAYRDGGSSSAFWLSGPAKGTPGLGTGVFFEGVNENDRMIAYAEAEMYNAVAETIRGLPGGTIIMGYPWQVWSTMGMNWQPRLTPQTGLRRAVQSNSTMRDVWERAGVEAGDFGTSGDVDTRGEMGTH